MGAVLLSQLVWSIYGIDGPRVKSACLHGPALRRRWSRCTASDRRTSRSSIPPTTLARS